MRGPLVPLAERLQRGALGVGLFVIVSGEAADGGQAREERDVGDYDLLAILLARQAGTAKSADRTGVPADLSSTGPGDPAGGHSCHELREHVTAGTRSRRSRTPPRPAARVAARRECAQPSGSACPAWPSPRPWGLPAAGQGGLPGRKMKTQILCRAYGSGRASRRSRNTMRVKPYAIRFPSRYARHTALSAPGGRMSTSGCSCRYRSSLRTCTSGPGGTSCTGQYRHPVSGQRNGFPKSPATRHRRPGYECLPPSWTCRCE